LPTDGDQTARRPPAGQLKPISKSETANLSSSEDISSLRTAVTAGTGASSIGQLLTAGFSALDLLSIGLIVCGFDGQMLVANDTARAILQARDGLELNAEGVLSATHENNTGLGKVIRQVAQSSRTREAGGVNSAFLLRRPSGKRALTLFIRAVNSKTERASEREAAVLVMILDAAIPMETREAGLRQLYGFTAMEAQVANLLMEGNSLEDCCADFGIRRTTVRMHLRNIFAKTGVRRQGELVSLLLKSIGLGPRLK